MGAQPNEQFSPAGRSADAPSLTAATLIERLESAEFVVARRGYDQVEVDRFLKGLLADLGRIERNREREESAAGEPGAAGAGLLQQAEREAAEVRRQAAAAAQQMLQQGRAEAAALIDHARRGLERLDRQSPQSMPLGGYGAELGAPLDSAARRS